MGTVRWACRVKSVSMDWDTDKVAIAIRGGKKLTLRLMGATLDLKRILTSRIVHQLVAVADGLEEGRTAVMFLVAWYFLLRVVSECIPLCFGTAENLVQMEPTRHSAMWIDDSQGSRQSCIRWARGKHRPRGAVMKRKCVCAEVGPQCCVVCRVAACTHTEGERLIEESSHYLLKRMRRYLALLQLPQSEFFTWKAFRSGRATEMAAQGYTLGQVLLAGDWQSVAMLRYIKESEADAAECIRQAAENSDEEEE